MYKATLGSGEIRGGADRPLPVGDVLHAGADAPPQEGTTMNRGLIGTIIGILVIIILVIVILQLT